MTRTIPLKTSRSKNQTLADRFRVRIAREGPISFYEWMKAALYDPIDGYYCRADRRRQGRAGDYRTAPETSPLFAATFARYFAKLFAELGSPKELTILEAGAGEGDFAFGVLSSLQKHHRDAFDSTTYLVDEFSGDSRARSSERLAPFREKVVFRRLAETKEPVDCGIVFSNELIDAFPVHRMVCRNGKLRELCVDWKSDQFAWIECDVTPAIADYLLQSDISLGDGKIFEVNLEAEEFISRVASSLKNGFLITVDYGAEREQLLSSEHRLHGTLRAFRQHQLVDDPLLHPGEQDLTTTVDWTQIREAGERVGLESVRHERLDRFLLTEGLLDVLEELTADLPESEALRLRTSARDLVMPQGMAASFQVLVQQKQLTASSKS